MGYHYERMSQDTLQTLFLRVAQPVVAPLIASGVTQPILLSGSLYGIQDACAELIVDGVLKQSGQDASQSQDVLRVIPSESEHIDVTAIRELLERTQLSGARGRRYIILSGVERMTIQAANALLKSIEEHSSRTCWILTTTHAESVPQTLRSRCRNIALPQFLESSLAEQYPGVSAIVPHGAYALWQRISASPEALSSIELCAKLWTEWSAGPLSRAHVLQCLDALALGFPDYEPWLLCVDCGIASLESKVGEALAQSQGDFPLARAYTQLDFLKELRHTISHHGNKTLILEALVCNIYDRF